MFNFIKKNKEKKEKIFLESMIKKIRSASNEELKDMNDSYHYGIDMSRKMGDKVSLLEIEIDKLIEDEMHFRGLKTLDDLEEEIWFARH